MRNIYTTREIQNALVSASYTALAALNAKGGHTDEYAKGYQDGFQKALLSVALSFGLVAPPEGHRDPSGAPEYSVDGYLVWR